MRRIQLLVSLIILIILLTWNFRSHYIDITNNSTQKPQRATLISEISNKSGEWKLQLNKSGADENAPNKKPSKLKKWTELNSCEKFAWIRSHSNSTLSKTDKRLEFEELIG